ncbi:unnamed protein product [Closterium sp. NIES-54]
MVHGAWWIMGAVVRMMSCHVMRCACSMGEPYDLFDPVWYASLAPTFPCGPSSLTLIVSPVAPYSPSPSSPPSTQHDLFDPVRYASLKGFADDVSLLLDELGIQASSSWQEITFIGHQQAGIVGLLLALQRPDLFHRVITLASSPR